MLYIQYPDSVNRVGIEWEGFWHDGADWKLMPSVAEIKNDGSLEYEDIEEDDYTDREIITEPMTDVQLYDNFKFMRKAWEEKLYCVNETVGLHFHVSFKAEEYIGPVISETFFNDCVAMMKTRFPKVYKERSKNSYCTPIFSYDRDSCEPSEAKKLHFKPQSDTRYHFINYTLEKKGTVEFRGYGGKHATVEGLQEYIYETMKIIDLYTTSSQVVREVSIPSPLRSPSRTVEYPVRDVVEGQSFSEREEYINSRYRKLRHETQAQLDAGIISRQQYHAMIQALEEKTLRELRGLYGSSSVTTFSSPF